ncbi:MAG TPA: sugar ABC transporter substrate-binding protein [Herpetosiphonaceae bacterium]
MSNKRIYLVTLLLSLLLPLLAACGGGGAGTTTTPGAGSPAASAPGSPAASAEPSPAASEAATGEASPAATSTTAADASPSGSPAGSPGAGGAELDFSKLEVEDGAQLRFLASGNNTEQQLYTEGAERFNQLFPNAKLTFEPVPAEYETTITAGFSGGNAPDVFLLNGQLMGTLAPQGLLLPLDDTMSQVGRAADDYYESLISLYQADGKTYGLPKDFNPLVLFVNTDLAQKAGVDPASVKTWNDLRDAAKKMTQGEGAGKVYGLCLTPDIERYGASMLQNGNPIIENGKAVFNNEKGIQAIQFWKDVQEEGSAATFQDLSAGWCGEAFAKQAAAMVVEGGWLVPFMADPQQGGQDVKYTAVPLPTPEGGQQTSLLFTNGFAANANTKYPKAAAAAVLFLTSEQNQQALIPSGLAQPSLQSLADDPYFAQNPVAQTLVQAAQNGRVSEVVFGGPAKKADVVRAINQNGIEAILVGGSDVKSALDAAAQEVDQIMQR